MRFDKKEKKFVPTEKETRKQIREYLNMIGVRFWYNMGGALSYRGLPDLEGIYRGKHFYIEVKSLKGKLSDNQTEFKEMVESEGETVFVAHSFGEFFDQWKRLDWHKEKK